MDNAVCQCTCGFVGSLVFHEHLNAYACPNVIVGDHTTTRVVWQHSDCGQIPAGKKVAGGLRKRQGPCVVCGELAYGFLVDDVPDFRWAGGEPPRLTQTVVGTKGNCWQTCVASLLGVDPAKLPDQSTHERYNNPLLGYLWWHHKLTYITLDAHLFDAVSVTPKHFGGFHLLEGTTERTPELGMEHAVLGREGKVWWDPHPSRAGLVKPKRWGLLVPVPDEWTQQRNKMPCVCPQHLKEPVFGLIGD